MDIKICVCGEFLKIITVKETLPFPLKMLLLPQTQLFYCHCHFWKPFQKSSFCEGSVIRSTVVATLIP